VADKINYTTEALKTPGNLIYVVLAGGLTLLTGSWIVGAAAAVIEFAYLAARSGSRRFRRKVRRNLGWQSGVTPKQLAAHVSGLDNVRADRYQLFRRHVNDIVARAEQRELDEDPLIGGVLANLQTLSASYLSLLSADRDLSEFAGATTGEQLRQEIVALDAKIAQGTDAATIMALEQNRDLLAKRVQRYATIGERRARIGAQLDLMDSTVKSLGDQFGELSSPTDIAPQVDLVLANMNDARLLTVELETSAVDELPASVLSAQRSKG